MYIWLISTSIFNKNRTGKVGPTNPSRDIHCVILFDMLHLYTALGGARGRNALDP